MASMRKPYKSVTKSRLPFNFKGFIVAVITPFQNDSARSLDLSIISEYAKFLSRYGINGVLVNGSLGEGPSMTVQERKTVLEAWASAVKSTKQHLMVQIGGAPLPDVLELAKHAESIGVDSLLCLPELYFKPTTAQQAIEYLKIVGQAAPKTPLLYYHVPMFSNVNINVIELLETIGDKVPSFVGIKYTNTNLEEAMLAYNVNNKEFAVFFSSDQIMSAGFALGLESSIAGTLNMFPGPLTEILKATTAGDFVKARELQKNVAKAITVITKHGHFISAMKAAMALLTPFDLGPPRAPLDTVSAESIAVMKADLKALGLKLYQ